MNTLLITIILANVLFSYKGLNDTLFFRKYEFHIGSIRAGEQFRIITSAFLHADFGHFFFNMFALYLFAPTIINHFGNTVFCLIYAVSLLSGSLLTFAMNKNNYSYRAIGASGAVTGIMYAAILINPNMSINFIPAPIFGVGYLLYSIIGMKAKNDNIGHTAHFGGAIGALLLTIVEEPNLIFSNPIIVIAIIAPIIIFFVMNKIGKL